MCKDNKRSVFVIADSISIHYESYFEKVLASAGIDYARKKSLNLSDKSIETLNSDNGGNSYKMKTYLQYQNSNNITYDVLVINCGLHDLRITKGKDGYEIKKDGYAENLNEIIMLGKKTAKKIIWIRTTPVDDDMHAKYKGYTVRYNQDVIAYNLIADDIMKKADIASIDLYSFTDKLERPLHKDGVHFRDDVIKLQGEYVAKCLAELI